MIKDWVFVAALCLARAAFGYQFQGLAVLGPELLERFRLDYAALGTLIGLFMLPGLFAALPGGLLGRRFGARVVVGLGLALMVLGGALPALVFSPWGIGAGRVIAGVGAVALLVMQGKMVSDRFEGRAFLLVMAMLVAGFPVGVGLVGVTQALTEHALGPAGVFITGAALSALSLLLFLPSVHAEAPVAARWALPGLRECILVGVAGLIWTAYNSAYAGFLSYMPSLLTSRGHPPGAIATVMVVATWLNFPAMLWGGALAGRRGNTPVFLVGTAMLVTATAGAALLDWPVVWGVLFGTAGAIHAGVIVALGTLSARPENRAVGMGLFYTIYYGGGAFLPALCGRAADAAGSPAGALLLAAVLAGLAVPFYALHRVLERRWA